MFKVFLMVLMGVGLVIAGGELCYAQDAGQRSQDLAASLNKNKYKKKVKENFSFEFYLDIKNTPAPRSDASEYSGRYACDDHTLDLTATSSGAVTGSGHERDMNDGRQSMFTLRDGRISGAVLTATKVYETGETRPFEAVFVDRTESTGK